MAGQSSSMQRASWSQARHTKSTSCQLPANACKTFRLRLDCVGNTLMVVRWLARTSLCWVQMWRSERSCARLMTAGVRKRCNTVIGVCIVPAAHLNSARSHETYACVCVLCFYIGSAPKLLKTC